MPLLIRHETEGDIDAIRALTQRAFAPMPFAAGDEQDVPDRLRRVARLALSLVGVEHDAIVAHIAFSRLWSGQRQTNWYALGPVSVAPERQNSGFGGAIIRAGLSELTNAGAGGFALTGAPAYYRRFGFILRPECAPPNEPAEYFQVLSVTGEHPPSALRFDPAFYDDDAGLPQ